MVNSEHKMYTLTFILYTIYLNYYELYYLLKICRNVTINKNNDQRQRFKIYLHSPILTIIVINKSKI